MDSLKVNLIVDTTRFAETLEAVADELMRAAAKIRNLQSDDVKNVMVVGGHDEKP